jgi:hypothetical protein
MGGQRERSGGREASAHALPEGTRALFVDVVLVVNFDGDGDVNWVVRH